MSSIPFKPPQFKKNAFNCPQCNAYANQSWQKAESLATVMTNESFEPSVIIARNTHSGYLKK